MSFLRVLVACEHSGVVRDAFVAHGHDAWSCDLLPSDTPGPHITGDAMLWLAGRPTEISWETGEWHYSGGKNNPGEPARDYKLVPDLSKPWDLLIAHPDCRYLCSSGMHWTTRGLRDPQLTVEAIKFAEALWAAPIPKIAIENPVGCLSTRSSLGKPAQKIQPYEFGEDASKGTCLWLRGLPPLKPGIRFAGRMVLQASGRIAERWSNQCDNGQNKLGPSADRWAKRARTYPGIAKAMAEQWGGR